MCFLRHYIWPPHTTCYLWRMRRWRAGKYRPMISPRRYRCRNSERFGKSLAKPPLSFGGRQVSTLASVRHFAVSARPTLAASEKFHRVSDVKGSWCPLFKNRASSRKGLWVLKCFARSTEHRVRVFTMCPVNTLFLLVGVRGFEPPTSTSRT